MIDKRPITLLCPYTGFKRDIYWYILIHIHIFMYTYDEYVVGT